MKKSQNQKCKLYEITSFECNRIYAFIFRNVYTSFIGSVIRKVINQKKGKEKTEIIAVSKINLNFIICC